MFLCVSLALKAWLTQDPPADTQVQRPKTLLWREILDPDSKMKHVREYPSVPSPPSLPASPARVHTSTQQQVQDTLTHLETLWDDLGLTEEQRSDRKRIFYGHIAGLLEKILLDERALKSRIINQIEHNTIKILKLCEELLLEPEEAVDGLTLLDLDAVLQERLEKLHHTKEDRQETLRNLQEKDEGLCELLSEEAFCVPRGLVPSLEQLKEVEEHIRAMEEKKDEREVTYRRLKVGLLSFLEQLEQSPEDPFTREVVCSDDEDIPLDQATIQRLRTVHSDLEFQVKENMAKSLDVRERIGSLWALLEVSQGHQQAFLATAPGATPSSLAKLEEELERLKVLRLHNLAVFVEKLQKELCVWWDKCYVGEEEKERVHTMTADDVGEDVLVLLEGEVERWKNYHVENQELLSLLDTFLSLFRHMLELEERAKDPSRLFNTRGGALLQEEKAKKKVKTELPRVQERLEILAAAWEDGSGRPFLVYGQEVVSYLQDLWDSRERRREDEKAKRVQAKEGKVKVGGVTQARTPVPPSSAKKRGMEGEEPPTTKRPKHLLPPPKTKSPTKASQRSPCKTPRGKPLSELNRAPHIPTTAMQPDVSIQSITYDKFKDPLQSNEGLNSTTLDQAPQGFPQGFMKSLF
ncbi:Protein regulator of cytokinesis 1 [Chionoecetes opilio]|uniref:Protein regulator of cytokinesis 1 n=1 Tax=Chionoecetes opilio TaxID=41210 RepID=A0A8J4XWZ9_CHIOP|nr:Protein regulator of cytokinesis 1 [Chionoecetes opilio]